MSEDLYSTGIRIRRKALGNEHVDNSMKEVEAFRIGRKVLAKDGGKA